MNDTLALQVVTAMRGIQTQLTQLNQHLAELANQSKAQTEALLTIARRSS